MWIAISQRSDKNHHGLWIDNLENNYVNYFDNFGIKLITIPNSPKDVNKYFEDMPISAIILTGGNDVDPRLYDEDVIAGLAISVERDKTEKKLLEIAIDKNLPVLGICRGMQFINVFFEGKLIKNIKNEIGEKVKHINTNHKISIPDKKVATILGKKFEVNSYHNQGINPDKLSSKLKIFAKTADDIVEGFYHPSLPIAGIQWHPERKSSDEKFNGKIIKMFLDKKLFWNK